MGKSWRYILRALSIASLVAGTLPTIIEDKKISIREMGEFLAQVCAVCGWKTSVDVPQELEETFLDVSVE